MLPNVLVPENVVTSERSVEEAKVHVEVEKEYRRPDEFTATPPMERPEKVTEEVAVRVPAVRLPMVEEETS